MTRVEKITANIKVIVHCSYNEEHSAPPLNKYLFVYGITIENLGPVEVQLLKRHWDIFDSTNGRHVVDGVGVVGQQPTLKPGQKFYYESFCPLVSELGAMKGYFTFYNNQTLEEFIVVVPTFDLIFPHKFN